MVQMHSHTEPTTSPTVPVLVKYSLRESSGSFTYPINGHSPYPARRDYTALVFHKNSIFWVPKSVSIEKEAIILATIRRQDDGLFFQWDAENDTTLPVLFNNVELPNVSSDKNHKWGKLLKNNDHLVFPGQCIFCFYNVEGEGQEAKAPAEAKAPEEAKAPAEMKIQWSSDVESKKIQFLNVYKNGELCQNVSVKDLYVLKIGRDPNAHVSISDPMFGRIHAIIEFSKDYETAFAMHISTGSPNMTSNGRQIFKGNFALGDSFEFGAYTFKFSDQIPDRLFSAPAPEPSAASESGPKKPSEDKSVPVCLEGYVLDMLINFSINVNGAGPVFMVNLPDEIWKTCGRKPEPYNFSDMLNLLRHNIHIVIPHMIHLFFGKMKKAQEQSKASQSDIARQNLVFDQQRDKLMQFHQTWMSFEYCPQYTDEMKAVAIQNFLRGRLM